MIHKSNQLVVQRVPIGSIKPMVPRVRDHSEKQFRAALRSYEKYGQLLPAPVSETGEILDLEMMCTAMMAAGAAHVDVVVIRDKSPAELQAIRLMLNRLAQDASWNDDGLRKVLQELLTVDFDLDLTGFSPPEIDFRLGDDQPKSKVKENGSDIPPLGKEAVTKRGMIWQLGRHRVGCGEATDATFVATVLDGAKACAAFADPSRRIYAGGSMLGDKELRHVEFAKVACDLSEDQLFELLCRMLSVLQSSCKPSALIYCDVDWRSITAMNVAARHCGMALYNIAVWTKTDGASGGIYRDAHRMIPIYAAGNEPPLNNIGRGRRGRNRTNVWTYSGINPLARDHEKFRDFHPAAKPVAMVADALRDSTRRGDVVIDTLLGFGTTLMAAQETGRICRGTDPDPLYVDLIVRRWQDATGQDATIAQTSESFNSLRQKRLPGPRGR